MAERAPCPGCGRPIAYRMREHRREGDDRRVRHNCPHGRSCIAFLSRGLTWEPGDARHTLDCPACAAAVRAERELHAMQPN